MKIGDSHFDNNTAKALRGSTKKQLKSQLPEDISWHANCNEGGIRRFKER